MSSNLLLVNKQKTIGGIIGLCLALVVFASINHSYVFAVVEESYSTTATGLDENGNKMSLKIDKWIDNSANEFIHVFLNIYGAK